MQLVIEAVDSQGILKFAPLVEEGRMHPEITVLEVRKYSPVRVAVPCCLRQHTG